MDTFLTALFDVAYYAALCAGIAVIALIAAYYLIGLLHGEKPAKSGDGEWGM